MKIRSTRMGVAALSITALLSTTTLMPVFAEPDALTEMEAVLCGAENDCSITADVDSVVSGGSFTVDVKGVPGAEVILRLHADTMDGIHGPWGDPISVSVGADGTALDIPVQVETLPKGGTGGTISVLLADSPVTDWALGDDVELLSEIPLAWNINGPDGDGRLVFTGKPGEAFPVQFGFGIEGQEHVMQLLVDGAWVDLATESHDTQAGRVQVSVPPELKAGTYELRVKNITTGATNSEDIYRLKVDGAKPKPQLPKTGV